MVTLKTKTKITKENHKLILDLDDKVKEGEYDVVVILQEIGKKSRNLNLPFFDLPIGSDLIYRREEIYGEDCR